jgi:hypothetical protein
MDRATFLGDFFHKLIWSRWLSRVVRVRAAAFAGRQIGNKKTVSEGLDNYSIACGEAGRQTD